jgi:hypothetical protein
VAVEVTGGNGQDPRRAQQGRCGLEVILTKGRRIELSRDFDAVQLRCAVEVLEGFLICVWTWSGESERRTRKF